jgi:mono/diheme cytochrome c family protein
MRSNSQGIRGWKSVVAVLAALVVLGWMAGRSGAQDEETIARGKITYRVYCQNCHGLAAKGDGRIASLMKVQPADLTQLSTKNGGKFPTERVTSVIDGRADVAAHGEREMPVWGQNFLDKTGNETQVSAKLEQLVQYLQTIQEKGTTAKK